MVIWILGISGSGKTTLAKESVKQLRLKNRNVVLIDGDEIREVMGKKLNHTLKDRKENADKICRLCKFLDNQEIDIICSILSIFEESRSWNRENLSNYYEVFINTSMKDVIKRDSKGIYAKYNRGEINNVVGMDINFPYPKNPDLIINNDSSKDNLLKYVKDIVNIVIES